MVPVVASNRVGTEVLLRGDGSERQRITFYGHTFITDNTGDIIGEVTDGADMIVAVIDKQANLAARLSWGVFRDRRPELYGILQSKDGCQLFR
jgi:N-carbamoylputrescine amidase